LTWINFRLSASRILDQRIANNEAM